MDRSQSSQHFETREEDLQRDHRQEARRPKEELQVQRRTHGGAGGVSSKKLDYFADNFFYSANVKQSSFFG